MSPERKERWIGVAAGLVPLLIALGVAWGTLRAEIKDKLPVERFVADSINRDHSLSDQQHTLENIQSGVDSANAGLRRLICRANPHDSVCP